MDTRAIKYFLADLRCLFHLPRRYRAPQGKDEHYWRGVVGRYKDMEKTIDSSDYHWRIIEYTDGRRELAYLRVLQKGLLSGMYPAIYRGLVFPRRIGDDTFANIKRIRLAF